MFKNHWCKDSLRSWEGGGVLLSAESLLRSWEGDGGLLKGQVDWEHSITNLPISA